MKQVEHLKNFQRYISVDYLNIGHCFNKLYEIEGLCPDAHFDFDEIRDNCKWVIQKAISQEIQRLENAEKLKEQIR